MKNKHNVFDTVHINGLCYQYSFVFSTMQLFTTVLALVYNSTIVLFRVHCMRSLGY